MKALTDRLTAKEAAELPPVGFHGLHRPAAKFKLRPARVKRKLVRCSRAKLNAMFTDAGNRS